MTNLKNRVPLSATRTTKKIQGNPNRAPHLNLYLHVTSVIPQLLVTSKPVSTTWENVCTILGKIPL